MSPSTAPAEQGRSSIIDDERAALFAKRDRAGTSRSLGAGKVRRRGASVCFTGHGRRRATSRHPFGHERFPQQPDGFTTYPASG
jgi:hypothetical protein